MTSKNYLFLILSLIFCCQNMTFAEESNEVEAIKKQIELLTDTIPDRPGPNATDEDQLVDHFLPPHGPGERQFLWWIQCHHVGPAKTARGRPRCEIRASRADAKYPLGRWAAEDNMPVGVTNYHTHGEVLENCRQDIAVFQASRLISDRHLSSRP